MKCAGHPKRTAIGVAMSTIAIVGLIMMGLAISEKGPFNKHSDSSMTPNGGNSVAPLPSGAPEPSAPAIRPIAAVFALQRLGVPADLMRESYEHANANEWKCLKFAFNRTPQTAHLLDLINRYDNALLAAKRQNEIPGEPIYRRDPQARGHMLIFHQVEYPWSRAGTIGIADDGRIVNLEIVGLTDDAIRDLSFLPKSLKVLHLMNGSLTHFDFSTLPRGLRTVIIAHNQISKIVIESLPPSLKNLFMDGNPLDEGITFKPPLPRGLYMAPVPRNVPWDLNGGQMDQRGVVTWPCGSIIDCGFA